ncbi:hypothetical protein CR513_35794, partial [Mucuna pruriens]
MTLFPSYFTSYFKVSKKQLIIVANGDLFLLLDLAMSNFSPLYPYRMILQHGGQLELLKSKSTWATSQILLHHKRLRHPPFDLLKTMFPHLFTKESVESFNCDVCRFSKHHYATFSPSNNKSLEPFVLIHSDVWGPASNFILGAK